MGIGTKVLMSPTKRFKSEGPRADGSLSDPLSGEHAGSSEAEVMQLVGHAMLPEAAGYVAVVGFEHHYVGEGVRPLR